MLSIAVCDDAVLECYDLSARISEILEEKKLPCAIRQFISGKELLQAKESFDIIFLDIKMAGLDGLKTAELFRQKAFDKILIFVSSSREYVFEAYDVEAFGYLVKPIDGGKLEKVLERAVLKTENHRQEFILASRGRQTIKLFLDDIYYFEIMGRTIYAHGTDGSFAYYGKLGGLEDSLRGKGFFRCHKSYLINLKHVDGYTKQEAILSNGERIGIAKRRREEFAREMLKFMRENGGVM